MPAPRPTLLKDGQVVAQMGGELLRSPPVGEAVVEDSTAMHMVNRAQGAVWSGGSSRSGTGWPGPVLSGMGVARTQ